MDQIIAAGNSGFAPRCPHTREVCTGRLPDLTQVAPGHQTRCVRVRELALGVTLSERAPAATAGTAPEPMLSVEGLRVAFGERQVLEDVSLRVDTGRCVILLGESGSGKTTLARCVAGPSVLICDEVTSALDVSVQASIVELLRRLQDEMGLTLLFVTHNICLVRHVAQEVAVLRGGRIAELGDVDAVLSRPRDAYTRELLVNTPRF